MKAMFRFPALSRSTEPSLSAIAVSGSAVRIGASVTMAAIARHPDLASLARAARAVGGPAIRNMATVGGNLFAPTPYGDFAVALLALNATVSTDDGDLPIETFLAKPRRAAVPSSLRSGSRFRRQGGFRFLKVSRVKPKGISVLQHRHSAGTGAGRHRVLGADRTRLHGRPADARQGGGEAPCSAARSTEMASRRHWLSPATARRPPRIRLPAPGIAAKSCRSISAGAAWLILVAQKCEAVWDHDKLENKFGPSGRALVRTVQASREENMAKVPVQFTLNGSEKAEFIDSGTTLLHALRDKIGDTSPKGGCHQGTCGACSVIIDGELRLSCLTLAETCNGAAITTTSGLSEGGVLHPLQRAFLDAFATQCGFCTPGMIMAAKVLLDHTPNPSREDVVEALSGSICRCTGYEPIIQAVLTAARANSQNAA